MENKSDSQDVPFKSIGLSLSGGGSRAAAFHLGSLEYLERTGLASKLQMLSTVSGGSFTGMKYVLSMVEKIPFEIFFKDYYGKLKDVNIVKLALSRLSNFKFDIPSKRKALIVAEAQVLSEVLFTKADGTTALLKDVLSADIPLHEIVFNATEFKYGLDFRFQKSSNHDVHIGNGRLIISKEAAGCIRLADIVAASNCVPGLFEPMAFPDDFVWPDGKVPEEIREKFIEPLALMDGGIYDNQGIDSLLWADKRNPVNLDMFIISDASQQVDCMYEFPQGKNDAGFSLKGMNILSFIIYILCIASFSATTYSMLKHVDLYNLWSLILYIIPILLAGTTAWGIWFLRRLIKNKILPAIASIGQPAQETSWENLWNDLKKLTLGQIIDMVNLRITSLLALTSSVFMGRIRLLMYKTVYGDERYKNKRVSNLIYHLKSDKTFSPLPVEVKKPSKSLNNIADIAANMPTELWFDNDYELPCLVACGQATICYNLMKYLVRVYGNNPELYPENVKKLWNIFICDWNNMVEDPYTLLRIRLPQIELPMPPVA